MQKQSGVAAASGERKPAAVLVLLFIGMITGVFGGLFGLGGGVIMVPAMVLLLGYNQREAASTTPIAMLPAAASGLISYGLHGSVDWVAGLALALGVFVGAQIGARLLHRLSLRVLETAFLVFLMLAIASLWLVVPTRADTIEMNPLVFASLVLFGLIPGMAMSLLGIGGGIVAIPVLIAAYGASDIVAKGTSLVMVITGAITSTIKNLQRKAVDVRAGLIMGLGAAAITPFSVHLAVLLEPFWANALFSAFLGVVALQYLQRLLRKPKTAE
ncbi:MAG: sulfite exporter TauE/SafE family protein [Microbacteriaceae bacterium]|nr:sulfite exporter TauE/SafE family protein [Microbacteriaceae bacterium]